MSGLSTLGSDTNLMELCDSAFDTWALTAAQAAGDACAICHAQWPRPRVELGMLSDGSAIYGCAECAELAEAPATADLALA